MRERAGGWVRCGWMGGCTCTSRVPAASTREAPREEDKPPGADDDDEVMQDGSTCGPLSPMRPAVAPRARSPQATTPNPHALKISRGDDDGDPAALHGAFDAAE